MHIRRRYLLPTALTTTRTTAALAAPYPATATDAVIIASTTDAATSDAAVSAE